MPEIAHDLLREPIFSVSADGCVEQRSLSAIFAALSAGETLEFTKLQAHQQHAWHAFLVQLGAFALHRGGLNRPPSDEARWQDLLENAVEGQTSAFCLWVSDLTKPAFFQPPVPEESLDDFQEPILEPDGLDVLITAKNHDVKRRRIGAPQPEHWAYVLVSLQTMEGYGGRGNYGISRMNGGAGSRPGVGITRDLSNCVRFRRDVAQWLARRKDLLDHEDRYKEDGPGLLWLVPWDGVTPLAQSALDPFYIDVCRRVRLIPEGDSLAARFKPSQAERIDAPSSQGDTGDLWTPVSRSDGKAFSASARGLSYSVVVELLLGGNYETPALDPQKDDGNAPYFWAHVLPRGQSKTEGLRHLVLPIPSQVRSLMLKPAEKQKVHDQARVHIKLAGDVQKTILFPALMALLNGGKDQPRARNDQRPSRWTNEFDRRVDSVFFKELWRAIEAEPQDPASLAWQKTLRDLARDVLKLAEREAPIASIRRYQAWSNAWQIFEGSARNKLSGLYPHRPQRSSMP